MKKFLFILVSLVIIGYLVFSAIYFNDSSKNEVCTKFEVVVKDSVQTKFIHPADIEELLKRKELYPVGKTMDEINTLEILDTILTNKLVKSATVYTARGGLVVANIYQREPILRVISHTKGSFYIDNNREQMPVSQNFAVYVPLATGAIDEEYAKNELYDFAVFLNNNPDWNAWVEQIVVKPNKDVDLIPRAGDFRIVFGKLENYSEKFAKFALFIEEGLNVVGWNRYSEINLKYDNQVVCTKK
ncbi:MAG: hypothetical protein Q4G48_00225 [Bacteroidia bacterium]|nr:hypothetical protein [Bacteroidia bacterium]